MNYEIRELKCSDMDLQVILKELNHDICCFGNDWDNFFLHYSYNYNLTIYVMVILEGLSEITIGCATLIIEPKIIHNFGKVGHIEDVVIHPDYQGQGYGKILVQDIIEKAKEQNCYKVILDCDEKKVPFYEKCGMKQKSIGMALYF